MLQTLPLKRGMGDWNLSCLPRHLVLAVSSKIKVICVIHAYSFVIFSVSHGVHCHLHSLTIRGVYVLTKHSSGSRFG